MKYLILLLAVLTMLLAGCASNEFQVDEPQMSRSELTDTIVQTQVYKTYLYNNCSYLNDYYSAVVSSNGHQSAQTIIAYNALKTQFSEIAEEFIESIGLTDDDIDEIFTVESRAGYDRIDAVVAIFCFGIIANHCYVREETATEGEFIDCFLQVVGVRLIEGIISDMVQGQITRATLKAIVKAAMRTVGRSCNALTLTFMAGEIALCLWAE